MVLTPTEQRMLVEMLEKRKISSKEQKFYRSRTNFYRAIWKLRDMELVRSNSPKAGEVKEWELTLDGIFFARMLRKGEKWA